MTDADSKFKAPLPARAAKPAAKAQPAADEKAEAPAAESRKRQGRRRSKTLSIKQIRSSKTAPIEGAEHPDWDVGRPLRREDCAHSERPCLFVSCKHHLYLDVNPRTGSIKLNFPDKEVWELEETCALDVADRGGVTLEEVGTIMNLTRERIRQVEVTGLTKLRGTRVVEEISD